MNLRRTKMKASLLEVTSMSLSKGRAQVSRDFQGTGTVLVAATLCSQSTASVLDVQTGTLGSGLRTGHACAVGTGCSGPSGCALIVGLTRTTTTKLLKVVLVVLVGHKQLSTRGTTRGPKERVTKVVKVVAVLEVVGVADAVALPVATAIALLHLLAAALLAVV
jgi:hypothetical protein